MHAIQERAADLEKQLAGVNRVVAERDKALSEAEQELEVAQEGTAKLKHELQVSQSAHKKTKTAAAAELQTAKAAHASRIAEAKDKIADLTARLRDKAAALEALRQEHRTVAAELRGSLSTTKETLAGVEAKLSRTEIAATQAQQDCEKSTAEAQSKIDDLDHALEQTRQKAARDLAACRREGEESVAYLRGLCTEFSELGARQTAQGMLLSLADDVLRFRISKADLPKGQLPSLDRIAELLIKYPKLTARIEGHTDSKGRDETNLELSRQRAEAVKQALIERGVDQNRLTAEGIGEARPIADNASSAGRRSNRRVEIYVIEN